MVRINGNRISEILAPLRSLASRRMVPVTLYSKADCPLCEKAERSVLAVFGQESVTRIDIMGDRELEDAFIFRIPVLVLDDVVLAEGLISVDDARRARDEAARLQRERRYV